MNPGSWTDMALRQLHPDAPTLALLAGGELPFWRRWSAAWHVASVSDALQLVTTS